MSAEIGESRQIMRRNRSMILLLLLIGLVLRLPNLKESLWNDEIWATHEKLGNLSILQITILNDLHPPFYNLLMAGWIRILGDSELSIRLLPLLCGLGSIWLVQTIARTGLGEKTAWLASFLLAASPVHIWYSQEARSYSMLGFLSLLLPWAYLKMEEPGARRIWQYLYGLALFAGTLSHYFFAVNAVLLSAVCLWKRHPERKKLLIMNLAVLACLGGWFVLRYLQTGPPSGNLGQFGIDEARELFFSWFLFGGAWDQQVHGQEISRAQVVFQAVFFLGLGLMLLGRRGDEAWRPRFLLLFLGAIPCSVYVLNLFGYRLFIERSLFVVLPYFFMVLARGIVGIFDNPAIARLSVDWPRLPRFGQGVLIGAIVMLNILTLAEFYRRDQEWTVYKPNPDFRSTARYLESEILRTPERVTIFALVQPIELLYYDSRFRNVWHGVLEGHDVLRSEEAERRWGIYYLSADKTENAYLTMTKSGSPTMYLIHNRYWSADFPAVFENLREDPRFVYQGYRSFKGIDIHRFSLPGTPGEGGANGRLR